MVWEAIRSKGGCAMERLKLPVGIESFEEIRSEGFYYIDKTGLIRDLLNNWGKVNLFTRPRRFGKTLNMSMLKSFFEIGADKTLFDGLLISQEMALCEAYMGKFPVVFVSLKGVDGLTFEDAYGMLRRIIRAEAFRMEHLAQSNKVSEKELQAFLRLLDEKDTKDDILDSLKTFSSLLYQHYGQKVVLLIDEYDVPLDKAFHHGYYARDGSADSRAVRAGAQDERVFAIRGADGLPARGQGEHFHGAEQLRCELHRRTPDTTNISASPNARSACNCFPITAWTSTPPR